MRFFEILLLFALFVSVIGFFIPRKKRPGFLIFLPGVAALFALVHIVVEGYRFQMVFAYILTGILLLISVFQIKRKTKEAKPASKGRKVLGIVMTC